MVSPGDPGVSLCHSRSCREVDGETPNTLGDCDRGGDREKVRSAWGSEVREPGEGKCQNRSAWPFCRASCIGPGPDGYEKLSEQGWQDRVGWGRGKAAHQDGGGRGWERGRHGPGASGPGDRHFKQQIRKVGILGTRREGAGEGADWQVSKQQLLDEKMFMVQLAAVP